MQQQQYQVEADQNSPDRACCELLRAIARPSAADSQVRELAQDIRAWEETIRVAKQHRVLPLLFARITHANASLPPEAQQRLQSEHQRNVFHSMANAAELIALLRAFDELAIPVMPFKGVVLAATAYGDLTARTAGDLDLLVHPRDLQRATTLMLDRGYELDTAVHDDLSPVNPDYYEYHFERRRDGMVAELRWRLDLITTRFQHNIGIDWAWQHRCPATLAGAEVPSLDPQTTLLMLCMHGSKHVWSRLAWIVDVAQLLASHPGLNWNEIEREARRTGLWRTLALGVLLAHRIAGAELPAAVLRRFESNRSARRIAQHVDATLFAAPGSTAPGLVPYPLRLLGFRDRLRSVLSLDLFKPSDRDRAAMPLPRRLHFLYYLIRPLRLLTDRSPR